MTSTGHVPSESQSTAFEREGLDCSILIEKNIHKQSDEEYEGSMNLLGRFPFSNALEKEKNRLN